MSALSTADYRDPAEGGLWTSLNRFLATLIVVIIATAVGYQMLPEMGKRREQEKHIESLMAEIDQQKQLLARRTREEKLLKSDPEYVGLIARDRLDLMKEGETIYRLDLPKVDTSKMRRNN
ncbi:FtsB family cell division protein [Verrucomicrobiota bacterium sgz303538]